MSDLFAVHIAGPDDLYAAPSKSEAERVAKEINATIPNESCIEATVIVWPHDALSHARDLLNWENVEG